VLLSRAPLLRVLLTIDLAQKVHVPACPGLIPPGTGSNAAPS